ncbi:hypothetical protein [Paenibacillus ferrarius]
MRKHLKANSVAKRADTALISIDEFNAILNWLDTSNRDDQEEHVQQAATA